MMVLGSLAVDVGGWGRTRSTGAPDFTFWQGLRFVLAKLEGGAPAAVPQVSLLAARFGLGVTAWVPLHRAVLTLRNSLLTQKAVL